MASWVSLPDLAVDDEREQGESPLLYSERRTLPQQLHAENQTKLQTVGANLSLAIAETTLRATTPVDEVDKHLLDLATVVTVGCRLRTMRRVVYVPTSPNEGTIELSAELAVGLRTKSISDQYAERFAELSLDGLGPGVAPQNLNRGSSSAMIGQFINAMDLRHCQGAACSYIWARAWSNFSVMAMAMTGELDAVWSAAPAEMFFEARAAGSGAAIVNHAAELFSGRGFVVEVSANEMDQYAPALRCLLSTGPIVTPRFDTTSLRVDGNVFDPLNGIRCPELVGRPSRAEYANGPVVGGEILMLASGFRFLDPITVWAINTGAELRSPVPGGAALGSLGDNDLLNAGAPILGNPQGADFVPAVAAVNKLRLQDLESAMRLLVRAFPSPVAVEVGWMLATNRMAAPQWIGATDGDNIGTTASGQLGSIAVPHSGSLISAHVVFGGFVQYQAKAADMLAFALKYFRGVGLVDILKSGWFWARVIGTALSQALRYVGIDHPAEASIHSPSIWFYTDGAGTKGKATGTTPAGWGWCARLSPNGDGTTPPDLTASGPVCTDQRHVKYIGARVGSNNTGELTAIIEALLYAHELEYREVVIYADSQWSLNMITGKWRPKTNKDLVLLAQTLAYEAGIKTSFQWVKGHAGHYYNCIADGLAAQGRDSKEYKGGRRQPIATHASQTTPPTMHGSLTDFLNAAKHSAQEHFPLQQRTIAKPWIREATLRALAQARVAQAEQSEDWKKLRNQAKRLARKDRVHWVHEQLLADPAGTTSPVWNTVRRQRKGFQGRRTQLIVEGKPVPWTSTHVAFRNHLQDTQWGQPHIPDHSAQKRSTRLPLRQPAPDEPLFTRGELLDALGKTKKGKAPGPDGIVNEILQLLDAEGERRLLEFYIEVWNNRTTPPDWSHATIVSIYKGKGDDSDPASYRPISLLNVTYKVYAAMLQARLASAFDERLRPQQFGFRAGRGTRHPLFVVRRAMEWSTMTNRNLQLLFLDWKQAFDSLDHTAMLQALQRFGLSHKMLDNIKSIYANPTFQTVGLDHTAVGQVKAGIRQGCPLSPYLFLIVLTVIFEDLDGELQQRGVPTNTWSEGFPVADMEYADDTLLLALTTPQLQSILSALEELAAEYGMSLNKLKRSSWYAPTTPSLRCDLRMGQASPQKL